MACLRSAFVAGVLLSGAFGIHAQTPIVVVSGRVVADETGEPLRRARIGPVSEGARASSVFSPASTLAGRQVVPVLTDGEGRFSLAFEQGPLTGLSVAKAGFATQLLPSRALTSAREQPIEIRLVRGAVISGRVLRLDGVPAVDAPVVARRVGVPGQSADPGTFDAFADDRGEYRIYGLPPGRYDIAAGMARPGGREAPREAVLARMSTAITVAVEAGDARAEIDFVVPPGLDLRSSARIPPEGRAVIRGRVRPGTVWAARNPMSNYRMVRLRSLDRPVTIGTAADAFGLFAFEAVPNGDYVLEASGPIKAQYGARHDIVGGEKIRVRDEDTAVAAAADSRAAINGTVVDDFGELAQGVRVQAIEVGSSNGHRFAIGIGVAQVTDDRGRYRLFGLPAGTYIIAASVGASRFADGGRPREAAREYYPGTVDFDAALTTTVEPGDDLAGIDMALSLTDTARVSGVVVDDAGEPLSGTVRISERAGAGVTALEPRMVSITENGGFEFDGLLPGEYVVQARAEARYGSPARFGVADVSVREGDIPPVRIVASRGATLAGRIVVESGELASMLDMRIEALPVDPAAAPLDGMGAVESNSVISSDGTFYLTNLHGPTRFALRTTRENWYLKSLHVGGFDAVSTAVDFGSGALSVEGVEAVVSSAGASIAGVVEDQSGAPQPLARVTVFAVQRDTWFAGSSTVRLVRADSRGMFDVRGLSPGDYLIAAESVTELVEQPDDWPNVSVLDRLASTATRLSLAASDDRTLTIRVSSP